MLIDLRHFGRICDSLGAQTCDNILCAVANRFEALINAPDIAARLGSDVFAIVLHGTGKDDQRIQAKIPRLLSVIKSPLTIGKQDVRLSCSSGVAFSKATDDAEELLAKAEQTLLGAKRRGTDGPGVYEPEAHASARRIHRLQGDLRKAISDQEFALYFQPQYRVLAENGHQLCGFEVLLRWPRPGGMVPPPPGQADGGANSAAATAAAAATANGSAVLPGKPARVLCSVRQSIKACTSKPAGLLIPAC